MPITHCRIKCAALNMGKQLKTSHAAFYKCSTEHCNVMLPIPSMKTINDVRYKESYILNAVSVSHIVYMVRDGRSGGTGQSSDRHQMHGHHYIKLYLQYKLMPDTNVTKEVRTILWSVYKYKSRLCSSVNQHVSVACYHRDSKSYLLKRSFYDVLN